MNPVNQPALAALLLRVSLGTMFVAHALLKYFAFTLPGTAQFFASLGLPGFLGYVVFGAELVGGVLLILGVQVQNFERTGFTRVDIKLKQPGLEQGAEQRDVDQVAAIGHELQAKLALRVEGKAGMTAKLVQEHGLVSWK